MKSILFPFAVSALIGLGGCASLQTPAAESLAGIPVVEFGETPPAKGDFILYFPAGKVIPVVSSIKGSALAREAEATLNVTLKKGIYAYKQWASLDRKTWQPGDAVLDFDVDIKIPGPEHPQPGVMKIQVNLK
jgi:hypothetical protein